MRVKHFNFLLLWVALDLQFSLYKRLKLWEFFVRAWKDSFVNTIHKGLLDWNIFMNHRKRDLQNILQILVCITGSTFKMSYDIHISPLFRGFRNKGADICSSDRTNKADEKWAWVNESTMQTRWVLRMLAWPCGFHVSDH